MQKTWWNKILYEEKLLPQHKIYRISQLVTYWVAVTLLATLTSIADLPVDVFILACIIPVFCIEWSFFSLAQVCGCFPRLAVLLICLILSLEAVCLFWVTWEVLGQCGGPSSMIDCVTPLKRLFLWIPWFCRFSRLLCYLRMTGLTSTVRSIHWLWYNQH